MSNLAFQAETLMAGSVSSNGTVIFDNILLSEGNITYDSSTGIVTINETGLYKIDWWVAIQSSPSVTGAQFSLVSSQGDNVIGNSPLKTDEVVGIAVINAESVPLEIQIKNNTAVVYLASNLPVKASITIVKESFDAEEGPTGPTAASIYPQPLKAA